MHLSFWVVFALFYSAGYWGQGHSPSYLLINYAGVLLLYATYIYATLYVVYSRLLLSKMYLPAAIAFVVLLFASTYTNAWLYNVTNAPPAISFQNFLAFYLFLAAFTLAIKIARSTYLSLQKEIEAKQDLLNQKEYFLRAQIHPHFLFNTLNNFYGLALDKSDTLPGLMLRLSNILRHQIYHSESSYILLEKEVSYLQDYIELEKIRHAGNLSFNFSFPDAIPGNLFIVPSVLIVFFENAFKHSKNVSSQLIEISGQLKVENDGIVFLLENSYPTKTFPNHEQAKGLGLKNVKNRLNILGENNYTLTTKKSDGKFSVSLSMQLKRQ